MLLPIQNVGALDVGAKIKKHWKQRIYYKNCVNLHMYMSKFLFVVRSIENKGFIIKMLKFLFMVCQNSCLWMLNFTDVDVKFYRCGC